MRDWRVRSRLLALIAVPTVVAVVLGVIGLAAAVSSANAYARSTTLGRLAGAVTATGVALAGEQDVTTAFVAAGRPAPMAAAMTDAQSRTDRATAALRSQAAGIGGSYAASTQDRVSRAVFRLDALPALRAAAATSQLPAGVVVTQYSTVGADLLAVDDEIAQDGADPSLAASVRALGALSRARAELADERALVHGALLTGRFEPTGEQALIDADAARTGAVAQFRTAATLPQAQLYDDVVAGTPVDDTAATIGGLIRTGAPAAPVGGPPAADAWTAAASGTLDRLHRVESALVGQVTDRANALRTSQITRAVVAGVIALAVLLIALLATLVVVRSLTRPLRALRVGATEVADDRLPRMVERLNRENPDEVDTRVTPIGVDSPDDFGADEIGEVARSFDDVHAEAVRLAAAEARRRATTGALFVNLSRRTQSLVERQLELIDDLERGEEDPERLGELYRLDHLATRMRRNGENLLVLGGEEPLRRWNRVMALLDVLRAAVSEVEQYTRVELVSAPEVWVGEDAVSDLIHLFAELVENATAFSAQSTPVRVETTVLGDRSVLVEVTDQGIGLDTAQYDRLNERLAGGGQEALGSEVSRRMGLVVVARLAGRRGVAVRLRPGPIGVTARVTLPVAVLAPSATPGTDADDASGVVAMGAGSGDHADDGSWIGERWSRAVATPGPGADSWFGGSPLASAAGVGAAGVGAGADSGGRHARRSPSTTEAATTWTPSPNGELFEGTTGFTPTAAGTTSSGLPQRAPGANVVPVVRPDASGPDTAGPAFAGPAFAGPASAGPESTGAGAVPDAAAAAPAATDRNGATATGAGDAPAPQTPAPQTPAPRTPAPQTPAPQTPALQWDRSPAAVRSRYAGAQRGRVRGLLERGAASTPDTTTVPDAATIPNTTSAPDTADGVGGGVAGGVAEPVRTPRAAGLTTSGLPQRSPGANYVPGSAPEADAGHALDSSAGPTDERGVPDPPEPSAPGSVASGPDRSNGPSWDRSAEAIGRRFAAHQQGRQRAQEARRS